jgi:hypothetical protein
MLNEPKLSFLCAIVGNKKNKQDITETRTMFLERCSGIPAKYKYEAINAAMHCFLRGYKN